MEIDQALRQAWLPDYFQRHAETNHSDVRQFMDTYAHLDPPKEGGPEPLTQQPSLICSSVKAIRRRFSAALSLTAEGKDNSSNTCLILSGAAAGAAGGGGGAGCFPVSRLLIIYKMRVLELFSGTKSIGRAFEAHGFEVVSLDNMAELQADICCDILTWDYTMFPRGCFDVIWASPPCQFCSIARSKAKTPRNLEYADSLVHKALEIIQYHCPRAFVLGESCHLSLEDSESYAPDTCSGSLIL